MLFLVIVVTEREWECSQHRISGMPNKPVKTGLPWASSGRKSSQFEAEIGIVLPLRIFSRIPFIGSLGLPLEKRMKHIYMLGIKGRKLLQMTSKSPQKVHIMSGFVHTYLGEACPLFTDPPPLPEDPLEDCLLLSPFLVEFNLEISEGRPSSSSFWLNWAAFWISVSWLRCSYESMWSN